jgi:hypothetical protein
MDRELRLETSTCQRILTPTGSLTEIVRLDGSRAGLADEDLERFIATFPVQ